MTVTSSSLMDGINRHVLSVASALASCSDVKIGVCVLHKTGDFNDALTAAGVVNWSLEGRNGHDFRAAFRFYHVLRNFNPDIVHVHVLGFLERIILKFFFSRVKVVTTIHGISRTVTAPSLRDRVIRILSRPFRLCEHGTVFISRGVYDYFAKGEPASKELTVIYNPMTFAADGQRRVNVLHSLLSLNAKVPIVGTACRLAEVKNPEALIGVMIRVLELDGRTHAVVVGTGDDQLMYELASRVCQHHLEGRIHFLGYRANAPELIAEFGCFVMTSHCEGLPTSLLECMSQKVPFAFMTGQGGLLDMEQLNAEKGPFAICVKKGEVETMAKEIVDLVNDPDRARAYAERAYVVGRETFDVNVIVAQLVDFYKRLF